MSPSQWNLVHSHHQSILWGGGEPGRQTASARWSCSSTWGRPNLFKTIGWYCLGDWTCDFFNTMWRYFVAPCKVLKQMGGRYSVHNLWAGLQDAVGIKLDWNVTGGSQNITFSSQQTFNLKSPFLEYFISLLDKTFDSLFWIFSQRPDIYYSYSLT